MCTLFAGKAGDPFWIEPDVLHAVGHAFQNGTKVATNVRSVCGQWPCSPRMRGDGSINRIGLPMIPPLFAQYNEDLGNRLNAGRPADDFTNWGEPLAKKMAAVVAAFGTAEDPNAYGAKIAHRGVGVIDCAEPEPSRSLFTRSLFPMRRPGLLSDRLGSVEPRDGSHLG